MVDQRLSRSRISLDADPQQLLVAQHAAQRGPRSRTPSPTKPMSEQEIPQAFAAPQATAPVEPVKVTEVEAPVPAENVYIPPPRPTFAEPSQDNDYLPPPRPVFAEVEADAGSTESIVVSPPTPVRRSPASPIGESPVSPGAAKSEEDKPFTSKTGLSRSGSGEASRVRGPRTAGPRTARTAMRTAASGSPPPVRSPPSTSPGSRPSHSRGPSANSSSNLSAADRAKDYAPKKNVGKANAAIFSRRTQASDAEDNVLEK